MRTHPHAEATYRVVTLAGGAFGIEVKIPDTAPTTISSFDSEAAAEAWIVRAKQRVEVAPLEPASARRLHTGDLDHV